MKKYGRRGGRENCSRGVMYEITIEEGEEGEEGWPPVVLPCGGAQPRIHKHVDITNEIQQLIRNKKRYEVGEGGCYEEIWEN